MLILLSLSNQLPHPALKQFIGIFKQTSHVKLINGSYVNPKLTGAATYTHHNSNQNLEGFLLCATFHALTDCESCVSKHQHKSQNRETGNEVIFLQICPISPDQGSFLYPLSWDSWSPSLKFVYIN
jgi:hypothetical protein